MLEYDDSAFFYFSLTLLTFYLVPVTFTTALQLLRAVIPRNESWASARTDDEKKKVESLKKEVHSAKTLLTSWLFLGKVASLVIGWAIVYVLLSSMTGESVGLAQFDPYAILGVDVGADTKAIKRSYRNLSLKYHPDKNPGNKVAEDMFMKIAKAYEALTDPVARENYIKYGNPDGKQPMAVSIALPTFLLDKDYHNSILILYLIAMVIVIPSLVAMWYASSKKYGENNVMYDTYTWYNHMLGEGARVPQIAEVLAGSAEYRKLNKPRKGEEKDMWALYHKLVAGPREDAVVPKLKYEHPIIVKGTVLLLAHLTRQDLSPPLRRDLRAMLLRSPELIEAMVELTVSRRWLAATAAVLDFSQYVVQGLWTRDSDLMQLPHVTEGMVKAITTGKDAPKSLKNFIQMEGAAAQAAAAKATAGGDESTEALVEHKSFLGELQEQQRSEVWAAMRAIPDVAMEVAAFVEDEEEIAEGDLVTIKVTITRNNLPDGDKCPPVYAPRYPGVREEGWWVLLASTRSNQVLSYGHVQATGRVCEKELKLMAPNRPSTVQLEVIVKSDSYLGLDQKLDVKFDVVSASVLPAYEPHPDDLELDNEPTLFEQVMQGYDESDSDEEEPAKDGAAVLSNGAAAAGDDGDDDDEESEED
ncbi:DnaJ-like/ Sec63 translocase subunit [Tribonema minus]|uniref:DnaJ-like/ Sec63 translocase subunit n=1 Tax=Tribonema minus TaxID=303371 RepID=A0A835YIF4_9STRA|nr:DnaJ-like/ Sec63 translocase subunit [Tribonema minus]